MRQGTGTVVLIAGFPLSGRSWERQSIALLVTLPLLRTLFARAAGAIVEPASRTVFVPTI
jgi:hypothetical protein